MSKLHMALTNMFSLLGQENKMMALKSKYNMLSSHEILKLTRVYYYAAFLISSGSSNF